MRNHRFCGSIAAMMGAVLVCVFTMTGCEVGTSVTTPTDTTPTYRNGDVTNDGVYYEMDGTGYEWSVKNCSMDQSAAGSVGDWSIVTMWFSDDADTLRDDFFEEIYQLLYLSNKTSETEWYRRMLLPSELVVRSYVRYSLIYKDDQFEWVSENVSSSSVNDNFLLNMIVYRPL